MSADAIVKSYIDRILRLKEEQDTLAADIREVYAEAKGEGYDKTAMGAVVAHLRKIEKHGTDACEERDAAFGLYLDAYERASGTALATHTHETIPPHDAETGEITEHEQPAHGDALSEVALPTTDEDTELSGSESASGTGSAGGEGSTPSRASIPDDDVPAFLKKGSYVLRPHCLNPSLCAGSGREHCHRCKRAMAESEAA